MLPPLMLKVDADYCGFISQIKLFQCKNGDGNGILHKLVFSSNVFIGKGFYVEDIAYIVNFVPTINAERMTPAARPCTNRPFKEEIMPQLAAHIIVLFVIHGAQY